MSTAALVRARPTVRFANRELQSADLEQLIHDPDETLDRRALLTTILTDADYECQHGNCAGDWKRPCGCWTAGRVRALVAAHPEAGNSLAELTGRADALDIAAYADLAVPRREQTPAPEPQEEPVQTSQNGQPPASIEQTRQMHEWYMAEPGRTLADVGEAFGISGAAAKTRFVALDLPRKPRGQRPTAPTPDFGDVSEDQPPDEIAAQVEAADPETPVTGIASAVVALERERDRLAERLGRVENAIAAVRELAA